MPGTGSLDAGQTWEIEVELKGPVPKAKADKFDAALREFIKKHKQEENLTVRWKVSKKIVAENIEGNA
jgi:ribosomal protein L31E